MGSGEPLAFGTLLRRYRRAAALTQEELAERAYMSVRSLGDLERGVSRGPQADTVALLAEGLDLPAPERAAFMAAAARLPRTLPAPLGGLGRVAGGPAAPPFVGRTRELGVLERHLRGEGPPLLVLAGEPGIGKTRLLQAVLPQATGAGLRVLLGAASAARARRPMHRYLKRCSGTSERSGPPRCGYSWTVAPGWSSCCPSWQAAPSPRCPPGRCRRRRNTA
jgi:transcriptional regulator with XRE-family HTH domain